MIDILLGITIGSVVWGVVFFALLRPRRQSQKPRREALDEDLDEIEDRVHGLPTDAVLDELLEHIDRHGPTATFRGADPRLFDVQRTGEEDQ